MIFLLCLLAGLAGAWFGFRFVRRYCAYSTMNPFLRMLCYFIGMTIGAICAFSLAEVAFLTLYSY